MRFAKYLLMAVCLLLCYNGVYAQASMASAGPNNMTLFMLVGISVVVIFHMFYVNAIVRKLYPRQYTEAIFREHRLKYEMPAESTVEENEQIDQLLQDAFLSWTLVGSEKDEDGDTIEYRKPTRKKDINRSVRYLDIAINKAPTDNEQIERINELAGIINDCRARSFYGSKVPIWIGGIVGIGMAFIDPLILAFFIPGIIIYWGSCQVPQYLIEKREVKGSSFSLSGGILAGVLAMIGGAKTIRTTTTYTDGRKEVDDDHSQHWISLVFGFIIIIILGFLIYVFALLNYLRNYVFC